MKYIRKDEEKARYTLNRKLQRASIRESRSFHKRLPYLRSLAKKERYADNRRQKRKDRRREPILDTEPKTASNTYDFSHIGILLSQFSKHPCYRHATISAKEMNTKEDVTITITAAVVSKSPVLAGEMKVAFTRAVEMSANSVENVRYYRPFFNVGQILY